jgi:hypothetical protein
MQTKMQNVVGLTARLSQRFSDQHRQLITLISIIFTRLGTQTGRDVQQQQQQQAVA